MTPYDVKIDRVVGTAVRLVLELTSFDNNFRLRVANTKLTYSNYTLNNTNSSWKQLRAQRSTTKARIYLIYTQINNQHKISLPQKL